MKMQQFFQKHDTSTLAWIMWSALALAYLIVFFHRLSLSVVLDRLMVDLQIEDAAVMGALAGSYAIIYVIMQPLLGYVLDLRWDGLIVAGTKVYPLAAYRGLFASCLLVLVVCFAISLATRETGCQNVYKKTGKATFP